MNLSLRPTTDAKSALHHVWHVLFKGRKGQLVYSHLLAACSLHLAVCASAPPAKHSAAAPLSGDDKTHGFRVSQRKDDVENVDVAQLNVGMFKSGRAWVSATDAQGNLQRNNLQCLDANRDGVLNTSAPVFAAFQCRAFSVAASDNKSTSAA